MPYLALNDYINHAKYTMVNNHRIAHWSKGQGETIVLIHGFPSASWDWHKQFNALAERYHVIAIDMLGFGLSDKPVKHDYSIVEQANIIEHVLKLYRVNYCHVLAHDYGVSVAQELLCVSNANQQDKNTKGLLIRSLCFLNGGLFAESHRPLLAQKLLKSPIGPLVSKFMSKRTLRKSFTRIFGQSTPPSANEIEVLWSLLEHNKGTAVLPKLLKYIDERTMHRERWVDNMRQIHTPLYLINGIQDPISGQHMLERYNELMPSAQSFGVNVGHYPQLEAPTEVLNLYMDFISKHRG